MENRNKKDSIIAAAITFVVALLILLWLFFGGLTFDRAELASVSTPEIQTVDEEELFLEPELLQDLGDPDAEENTEPEPAYQGEPELSEVENQKVVVPGNNENKTPPVEKPVTQTKPSAVTVPEPPKTNENQQKATSKIAGKFSNGASTGSNNSSGTGANSTGVGTAVGVVNGRKFLSCPKPSVALQNQVVVVVYVTINSKGTVTQATARSKSGNPSQSILTACRDAALKAKWNEDPATPSASGTITFTITPKK